MSRQAGAGTDDSQRVKVCWAVTSHESITPIPIAVHVGQSTGCCVFNSLRVVGIVDLPGGEKFYGGYGRSWAVGVVPDRLVGNHSAGGVPFVAAQIPEVCCAGDLR